MRRVARGVGGWKTFLTHRALLTRPSFAIPLHTAQAEQPRGEPEIPAILAQLCYGAFLNVFQSQRRVVATRTARAVGAGPARDRAPPSRTRWVPTNRIIGLTMPATTPHETAQNPVEGFRTLALAAAPTRVYLPTDYQPKYAYPLVVLFHADGECEGHAARLVPQLSRRNYVALCLRGGLKRGLRDDGRTAFGWGASDDRAAKAALRHALCAYSVHPDRVFLVGVGEGVSAASRLARTSRVAGLVALNGAFPTDLARPNDLRVLIAHGSANPLVPFAAARRAARRLTAAGAAVRLARYATSQRVHPDMLRDANRWIMAQVAAGK